MLVGGGDAVRHVVSNEDLGRMRVQFFRDAVAGVVRPDGASAGATEVRAPVVEVLAEVHSDANGEVSFSSLFELIDAREKDMSYPSFASLSALSAFAADTQAPLIETHARVLLHSAQVPDVAGMPDVLDTSNGGAKVGLAQEADPVRRAARFAGEAVGLAILLRGAPAHSSNRLSYAPQDLARDLGVSDSELLSGEGRAPRVYEAVAMQADRARRLAMQEVAGLPRAARPAFWGLHLPRILCGRLRAAAYNPFDDGLQRGMRQTYPLALQLSLLGARLTAT